MKKELLKIALRHGAIYLPGVDKTALTPTVSKPAFGLLKNLNKMGFTFSEPLLWALKDLNPVDKMLIFETLKEVVGMDLNWTPLVKGWDTPTGETRVDHIMTYFANIFGGRGAHLACGHIIPPGTFPLERYNGCPFCGTPFKTGGVENTGQGSNLKMLELWTETDMQACFSDLLGSKTALDATQKESLKVLLSCFEMPAVEIQMKETLMLVTDSLVKAGNSAAAAKYMHSPVDVMRYLWYVKTGLLQIVEPKTIAKRVSRNNQIYTVPAFPTAVNQPMVKEKLKLKYTRSEGKMVANWLNNMEMAPEKMCELMHPKRAMWVRFIRALRLAEYSKRKGMEHLAAVLDLFYKQEYTVWEGKFQAKRLKMDTAGAIRMLQQRPGYFARTLFANMLWLGPEEVAKGFKSVVNEVPARLVFTLNMYAPLYFDAAAQRVVKPLGGVSKRIAANQYLSLYDSDELSQIQDMVEELSAEAVKSRFAAIPATSKTMYIDPALFRIPLAIGERSGTIQDLPAALPGTVFPVEGNDLRLFMQWGKGLAAQHLDMDLSCQVLYADRTDYCSYSQLVVPGCKHSGDIRSIPDRVGTAEYINLDLSVLRKAGAKLALFTCNAYSSGSLSPNLVVGWMNSQFAMRISETTGVAYDPSCVQHQVRITQSMDKGLLFGALDVEKGEVTWLEMPFGGPVVQGMDYKAATALMNKLNARTTIGNLLKIKAEAQQIALVETTNADEVYDFKWALNTAAVTQLLMD